MILGYEFLIDFIERVFLLLSLNICFIVCACVWFSVETKQTVLIGIFLIILPLQNIIDG